MAENGFDAWLAEQWQPGENRPIPLWLSNREAARKVYESLPATTVPEANRELDDLRRRVAALERRVSDSGTLIQGVGNAMGRQRKQIRENEIAEIERRVAELERSRVKYHGVHEHGVLYPEGSMVTRAGSLWYATKETREAPGEGATAWTLAVKRGASR
jgi:hypothetical protein